jgi:hypothetical protein
MDRVLRLVEPPGTSEKSVVMLAGALLRPVESVDTPISAVNKPVECARKSKNPLIRPTNSAAKPKRSVARRSNSVNISKKGVHKPNFREKTHKKRCGSARAVSF